MSTTQAKYASTQSGVYSGNITIVQPRRRTDMGTRARPLNHLARAARTKREL